MTHRPYHLSSFFGAPALLLALGLTACTSRPDDPGVEYAPEMYESLPYEPLRQISFNTLNAGGTNERIPAVGTIPRGKMDYYTHIPKDSVSIAERVLHNPFPYTKANLLEGQTLYQRFCQHCHGEQGNGQGPVGIKYKGVPNYATGAYKTMNDGHIFHVIEWGRNRMMPHGSQVNPEERWKIAMYVHVLQRGEGPDVLDKLVAAPASPATGSESQMPTQVMNQAGADKGSETPGQGMTAGGKGSAI